jgi:NADH:ubiquinone oxidoreductase subunit 4 (subunit M)
MVLVVLAQSLAAFYLGYVAVSLAAYLMIVHARSDAAWRAGRIYLVLAFAGEAAIVSGVLVLAGYYGNVELALLATPEFAAGLEASRALLLVGFAVKLGIVPLHVWLPLAHPIAPVPASAILSGVIVKAGLLGWLKLAPVQGIDAAAAAPWLIALGLVTAFAGALLGLTQAKLKTVLAYSTISQMGLVLVAYAALAFATDAAVALAALGLLALHHGLTKAALFLACGCAPGASRARSLLLAAAGAVAGRGAAHHRLPGEDVAQARRRPGSSWARCLTSPTPSSRSARRRPRCSCGARGAWRCASATRPPRCTRPGRCSRSRRSRSPGRGRPRPVCSWRRR